MERHIFILNLLVSLIIVFIMILLYMILKLYKQAKYIDEADTWHKLAYMDDLTGIYNRTAYNEHVEKLYNNPKLKFSGIMLFDVDDFKNINDTSGHLAGDAILKDVAKKISEVFSSSNYNVYRIGGDEFAVIAKNATEREIIDLLIELQNRFRADKKIRVSKGYAMLGRSISETFDEADKMLYADKSSKSNYYV